MDRGLQWQLAIDFNEDNKSLSLFLAGLYHAPDAPSLLRERRSQTGEVEPHSSALCPQNAFHSQLPPMASDSGFPFLEVIKRSFNHEFIYYYY